MGISLPRKQGETSSHKTLELGKRVHLRKHMRMRVQKVILVVRPEHLGWHSYLCLSFEMKPYQIALTDLET